MTKGLLFVVMVVVKIRRVYIFTGLHRYYNECDTFRVLLIIIFYLQTKFPPKEFRLYSKIIIKIGILILLNVFVLQERPSYRLPIHIIQLIKIKI